MNYSIIRDKKLLEEFIEWLPDLRESERYYLALFARKKYCADIKYIKHDKWQCKRVLADKKDIITKIRQMECPIGSYVIKGISIPQEALALYISVNPRDMLLATKNSLVKFAKLITQPYNGYNPFQECMSECHRAVSRKVYFDFDFDNVDLYETLDRIEKIINIDCVKVIKTIHGFHVLVKLKEIHPDFQKTWYQEFNKLDGIDVRGDNLIPLPGCTQGNFIPHFISIFPKANSIITT